MLSSVLNNDRAIAVNIEIMRSFVRIRTLLESDKSLAHKYERLERKLATHDQAIVGILAAIRQLITPPNRSDAGLDSLPIGGTEESGMTSTARPTIVVEKVPP